MPTSITISPDFSRLQSELVNLDAAFIAADEILYDVRNTIKKLDLGGTKLAVKSFRPPRWPQSSIYAKWRASKAERSYRHAIELLKRGINTPAPVAYTQTILRGRLTRSYYVSLYHQHESSLAPILQRAADTALAQHERDHAISELQAFVAFTYRMHEAGVLHLDHNTGNTLVQRCEGITDFAVIDINRVVFTRPDLKARMNNFVRLTDSEAVLRLIAQRYAICAGEDSQRCIDFLLAQKRRHLRKIALKRRMKSLLGRDTKQKGAAQQRG